MRVVHFRLFDTGRDEQYFSSGVFRVYNVERQRSKNNWEQVIHDHPVRGWGLEQAISNCRFMAHNSRGTIHAYQIDEVDPAPLIAVPEGYAIEKLARMGSKPYTPDWYRPYAEHAYREDWDRVFQYYGPALAYLRERVGSQEYEYDVYTGL